MIPKLTFEQVLGTSRIDDFTHPHIKGYGQNKLIGKCPACGYYKEKEKKGLTIDLKKNNAHCYKCHQHYSNPVDYVMKTENKTYPEALKQVAERYHILIEEETTAGAQKKPVPGSAKTKKNNGPGARSQESNPKPETRNSQPETHNPKLATRNPKPEKAHLEKTFCQKQLEESGLGFDDIRIEIKEGDTTKWVSPFIQGTRQYEKFLEHRGDDMLVKYYDLDGNPVMYKPENGIKMQHLVRVRWQNPLNHLDQSGKPIKYQSPAGSGSHVYIPESLRRKYRQARKIRRLYIQEGEKKAEKACKHGMMSIGIMGIHNLGHKNRMPDDVQKILQRCQVEDVIFLLDSDWRDLNKNLKNGDHVDSRPRLFFTAVLNYKAGKPGYNR